MIKQLDYVVFPSEEKTISVEDDDQYGGAHRYVIRNCRGFNDGKTEYIEQPQVIQFVKKLDDGTIIDGLQSEQLALVLFDRAKKLNERFPSTQNETMLEGLKIFLQACQDRVQERMSRGVMGELKK